MGDNKKAKMYTKRPFINKIQMFKDMVILTNTLGCF